MHASRARITGGLPWLLLVATAIVAANSHAALFSVGGGRSEVMVPGGSGGPTVAGTTARCTPGKTAVANGFNSPAYNQQSRIVARLTSRRTGRDSVYTSGINFSPDAGPLVSFAYCGEVKHPIQVASASVEVPPQGLAGVTAQCPPGSEAISGGFESVGFNVQTGPRVIPITSYRVGPGGWRVEGFNIPQGSGDPAGTMVAYAHCLNPPPRLVTHSVDVTVAPGNPIPETVDVPCPTGSRALSGGFDGHLSSTGGQLGAVGAIASRRFDRGRVWRTKVTNATMGSAEFTAYAYCRRRTR